MLYFVAVAEDMGLRIGRFPNRRLFERQLFIFAGKKDIQIQTDGLRSATSRGSEFASIVQLDGRANQPNTNCAAHENCSLGDVRVLIARHSDRQRGINSGPTTPETHQMV